VALTQVLPDLSLEDTALFFARAGAAAYDASIAGWKVCTWFAVVWMLHQLLQWQQDAPETNRVCACCIFTLARHTPFPLQVKYSTLAWRPITAFNQGYPRFEAQPEWRPLL
jgi:hypothetical protein